MVLINQGIFDDVRREFQGPHLLLTMANRPGETTPSLNQDFIRHVHRYVARYSVSASAARGQQAPGLVQAAREHLSEISLSRFAVRSENLYVRNLDEATIRLRAALPRKGRSWGISRKLLNIFLRNALYTTYLCERYHLARSEKWYEIPLDSIVAKRLKDEAKRLGMPRLPRWPGVKHVTPELSELYQSAASIIAETLEVAPVHLDALWWGGRSD